MESDRQFRGVWIPKEVWISEDLNLQEKVVLVEIDSLETEKKGCYASNKYFSDFFKLSMQRVSQIIQELGRKGYIKIEYIKDGNAIKERQIRICKPPYPEVSNIFDRGIKYSLGGYQENFKENNIYMNNINNKEKNNTKKKESKSFIKPTIEEIENYCKERSNGINAEAFYDFYESKNWYVGKNKMSDWKACVRTWEKRETKEKQKYNDGTSTVDWSRVVNK